MCGICGDINYDFICEDCLKIINKSKIDSMEFYKYNKSFCQRKFYILKYDGVVRDKIVDYKFNDLGYLFKTFQKIILNDKKVCDFIKSYDIIIPVPIHKNRKKERGYNQSSLIIKGAVRKINLKYHTNIIVNDKVLIKKIDTPKQSLLKKAEREKNIKNVYFLNKKAEILNKRILIFDDVYTTGNTVKECTKTLLRANPMCIDVLTLTKD